MKTIYFDEAGNTGQNLIDRDQPYHVLLSHALDIGEVELLLNDLLNKVHNPKELHFKNLKKTPKYQGILLQVLNNELIKEDKIYYSISDKLFCIIAQIVNQLMEYVFYQMGYDIYKKDESLWLANYFYFNGKLNWGDKFDDLCR